MKNQQTPEKRATGDGTVIAVNSIFYTIQGEGPFAGMPAVFIRLAGCNLQCPMCDTEYTYREELSIVEAECRAFAVVAGLDIRLAVITGGEPFRQPIGKFVHHLLKKGWRVQIETNGTMYPGEFEFPWPHTNVAKAVGANQRVFIVCSPKTSVVHRKLVPYIDAFKYVGQAGALCELDGLPLHALRNQPDHRLFRPPGPNEWQGEVYLQPADEQDLFANAENQNAVVQSCLKHGYRLCLQMHKIIGVA